MTTWYYHPTLGNDTTAVAGNYEYPRKTLVTNQVAGDSHMLAAGQTFITGLNAPTMVANSKSAFWICTLKTVPITFSAYDPATGKEVVNPIDVFQRAKAGLWVTAEEIATYYAIIDQQDAPTFDNANQAAPILINASSNVRLANLYIKNTQHSAIRVVNNSSNIIIENIIVENCLKDSTSALSSKYGGCGIRVEFANGHNPVNVKFRNIFMQNIGDDGFWAVGARHCKFQKIWMRNLAQQGAWDAQHCDAFQFDGYPGNLLIEETFVDHVIPAGRNSLTTLGDGLGFRTGACLMSTGDSSGGRFMTPDAVAVLRNNIWTSTYQILHFESQGALVESSVLKLAYLAGKDKTSTLITPAKGAWSIRGNVLISEVGKLLTPFSPTASMAVLNNTIVSTSASEKIGLDRATGQVNVTFANNVVIGAAVGMIDPADTITSVKMNNRFYNCTRGIATASGAPELADGTNAFGDPMLGSDYRLLPGSPCIGAGKFVQHASDASGRPFSLPPSAGAYETSVPLTRLVRS